MKKNLKSKISWHCSFKLKTQKKAKEAAVFFFFFEGFPLTF
jgi:hypothetical protein